MCLHIVVPKRVARLQPHAVGRGLGVGLALGVGVALGVGLAVGVGVELGVAVGVGVGVPLGQWLKAMCALSAPFWAPGVATLSVPMLPFMAGQASIDPKVPPIGVGSPRRAAINRLPSVNPSTRRSAGIVAIKISPEHDIPCRVDCLHWITGECQAKAFSTVDRIEEHDDFSPISRSSRKPTRVERFGSRTVISKKGDLSGIVN